MLAIALSMDSFAVSAAGGAAGIARGSALRLAVVFSLFHIAMSTIGWMIGTASASWIESWDHWVAFGLLTVIGVKMVISAIKPSAVAVPASWGLVVGLALATSLDAVAAGVTLPLLAIPELLTIGMIGLTVLVMSLVGVALGRALGQRLGRVFEVAGGIALVGIGVRIVLQHA